MPLDTSLTQEPLAQMKNQALALSTPELEELARHIEDVLASRADATPRHLIVGNMHDRVSPCLEPSRDFPGKPPDIFMSEHSLPTGRGELGGPTLRRPEGG